MVTVAIDFSQAVLANSTATVSIALGASDFNSFEMIIYNKNTITDTNRRRFGLFIMGTTAITTGISKAGVRVGSDNMDKGYDNNNDGFLSESQYSDANARIRVNSARINGSNLDIILEETTGTNETAIMFGRAFVFRDGV